MSQQFSNTPNAAATPDTPYVMDSKSREELMKANKLKEKGEFAKCEKKVARVVKKYPDCVPALHLQVFAQMKLKKFALAYNTLGKIIKYNPKDRDAHRNRILAAQELGDRTQLKTVLDDAYAQLQGDAIIATQYGKFLHVSGQEQEALPYYKEAIAADPELKEAQAALMAMASIFYQYKEYQSAVDLWLAFLQKHPTNHEVMCYIADTLSYLGKNEEANNMALQALAHNPDSSKAQGAFVMTLRDMQPKDFDEKIYQALYYCLSVGKMDFHSVFPQWYTMLIKGPEFEPLAPLRADITAIKDALDKDEVKAALLHPFFLLGLRHMIQYEVRQEMFLMRLRQELLNRHANEGGLDESWLPLLSALAECAFMNEFVWAISSDEKQHLEALRNTVEGLDKNAAKTHAVDIALLGMYEPLKDLKNAEALLAGLAETDDDAVKNMAQLQIAEPLEEREIAKTIETLSSVEDDVSQKVRAQYEVNPYPRWRSIYVADTVDAPMPKDRKQILVAGCGTGRHLAITAMKYPHADILGLDLSFASLSYAKRKIKQLGLPHISFMQGDILDVEKMGREFDHIESSGVLHHMDNPLEGWRRLVNILKPGGTMRIGLYSEIARQNIVAMREAVAKEGFKDDLDGIRTARLYTLSTPNDSPLKTLWQSRDFYSTSSCRDLIMHVQEHRYTIDRLKKEIMALGLSFDGMCPIAARGLIRYAQQYPDDPQYKNLDQIKTFEEANPGLFKGMYQFDLTKPLS